MPVRRLEPLAQIVGFVALKRAGVRANGNGLDFLRQRRNGAVREEAAAPARRKLQEGTLRAVDLPVIFQGPLEDRLQHQKVCAACARVEQKVINIGLDEFPEKRWRKRLDDRIGEKEASAHDTVAQNLAHKLAHARNGKGCLGTVLLAQRVLLIAGVEVNGGEEMGRGNPQECVVGGVQARDVGFQNAVKGARGDAFAPMLPRPRRILASKGGLEVRDGVGLLDDEENAGIPCRRGRFDDAAVELVLGEKAQNLLLSR